MERIYSIREVEAVEPLATQANSSWHFHASWTNDDFSLRYPDHAGQLQRFRWYLETHALADPLNSQRAAQIRKELDGYGDQLVGSLPKLPSGPSLPLFLDIYDCGDDSPVHSIPWELLEDSSRTLQPPVVIRRRATGAAERSLLRDPTPKTFNMLFLAARNGDDEDYQHASLPILRLIQDLPDGASLVSFEMVRPGTYQALVEHLERAASGERDIHLVHLDVHGKVTFKGGAKLIFSDRTVPTSKVAQLLKEHGIRFVVLNACESARGDKGLKANLAKTFVREGIPAVLAMSYKLNVSVVTLFTHQFYDALLHRNLSWARAASSAREAMRTQPVRKGHLGVQVDLQDWIVPVVYTSTDDDPVFTTSEKVSRIQRKRLPSLGRAGDSNNTGPADIAGRDADVLRIEEILLGNAREGRGGLLFLEGKMGVGKTSLLHYLQWWWVSTGMVISPIYVNLEEHRGQPLEKVCAHILRKLGQAEPKGKSAHSAIRQLLDYLSGTLGSSNDRSVLYPRPLLIFDQLWSPDWPLGKRSDVPHGSFWVPWKAFFENLLKCPAYTIVASHRWPWYLDDHPTSEFDGRTFHILPPLTLSRMDVALKVGRNYTLNDLLENSKDIERLDLILEWAGHNAGLLAAFLPFVRKVGVERAATALVMGEDILSYPEVRRSAVKRLPAYKVAKTFWKKAPSTFKKILIGFAPFHNFLPRCHESYSRNFTINKWELLHPVFDFLSKYNPEMAHKQTAKVLPLQLANVSLVMSFLPILKSMGLIRAESMMGSSEMQSGLPASTREKAPEGIMLHSIHPVFSLFLRHQAKKTGFIFWPGNGGKQSQKSICLEKTFVDYHEDRALEWTDRRSAHLDYGWDSSTEADRCKNSFMAGMEIKLRSPPERFKYRNIIPALLFWCWSQEEGNFSSPVSAEYLASAAERALVKCRMELDLHGRAVATAGLGVGEEYLGAAKEGVQLCLWLALHCIFYSAQYAKLAVFTSAAEEILKGCDTLSSFSNKHFFPERPLMEGYLEKIRHARDERGLDRVALLVELSALRGEVVGNNPSARGWEMIQKSLLIIEGFARVRSRTTALAFWDACEEREQLDILSEDTDSFLTRLAPIWQDFLSALDSDMLSRFRVHGFSEDDDGVAIHDAFWDDAYQDFMEGPAYLRLPNYGTMFMAAVRNSTPIEGVQREFDQTWEKWLQANARPFGLHAFEMSLDQESETQKIALEAKQIALLQSLNDWPLVFEHLDSLLVPQRALPLQSLNDTQLSRVAWWHINKGLSALRMCAWKECLQHINAVLDMVSERSDLQPSHHFIALLLMVLLHTNAPTSLQGGVAAASEAVYRALLLGYTKGNEATYARNGVLLSVLLRLGATTQHGEGRTSSALDPGAHAQLEYILSNRSDPAFCGKTTAAHLFATRALKFSQSAFPLSTAFLHTLLQSLSSQPDSHLILSQAESHLFLNTPFPIQTREQPDAPGVIALTNLPVFDLDRVFKPIYAGRLESVYSLFTLWMFHRFKGRVRGEEEEEVVMEEETERQLRYLGGWHAAARD